MPHASDDSKDLVGVVGAGTMGCGIAQVAAGAGQGVVVVDNATPALENCRSGLAKIHDRLVEKGKLDRSSADAILGRIRYAEEIDRLSDCALVIEAIVEDLQVKRDVFQQLERVVSQDAVLATNTSSLSITSIAACCGKPHRVVGVHFFNPAPLMALVEIVPGLQTASDLVHAARRRVDSWGKTTVLAKDTPGFIVNRVARPFYGEALRIFEEGLADAATIDWAMREIGGFRMGPFQLMDLIGNDINLKVTQTVFEAFFYDPRFRPSITQQRMVEAGRLGRKSGRGYYDYSGGAHQPKAIEDAEVGAAIFSRILAMLINEAADAVFLRIATPEDVDLAMTRGVNYPKGLLHWADEIGLNEVLRQIEALHGEYGDDRYRPNPLLRRMVRERRRFFEDA